MLNTESQLSARVFYSNTETKKKKEKEKDAMTERVSYGVGKTNPEKILRHITKEKKLDVVLTILLVKRSAVFYGQ